MEKLLKLWKTPSWQDLLATTDVWMPRGMLLALLLVVGGIAIQTPPATDSIQAGLAAQGQQEYWRAESFFQEAALQAPDDYLPLLDLARLHLLEHQDDLAQSELETARSLKADSADIWLTLGDVAQDQGHAQDAESAWLQAAHLSPAAAQIQAHERLGLLYEQQGHWPAAEAQFAALPDSDMLAQYHLGLLRLERGDQAGARQAFETVLTQTSDDSQRAAAHLFLQALVQSDSSAQSEKLIGYTYLQNGMPALAAAPLKQAIALAPNDASAHAYLGWVYLSSGSTSQAQQEEDQAIALEPGNSFANYVLSQLAIADGDYSSANNDLVLALISAPQNPAIWAALATIAEQLNDIASAERDLRQAVDDAGGDPRFSLLLATFYADRQIGLDNGTALGAAEEAVTLNPTNAMAYDALGRIQEAMQDLPDAMSTFMQAVNNAPTNASIHIHLGDVQITLGYLRSAELNLRKAVVLDMNGPLAQQAQHLLQTLPPLDI
jgi:tetratricopeptide (TPR) repeat protein